MLVAPASSEFSTSSFTTDDGVTYSVENTLRGMDADSRIRCLCGYTVQAGNRAHVYTAQAVPILPDASDAKDIRRDPTGILSAWLSGGFVNMHLTPKTQGGRQSWAFVNDSSTANAAGGTTYHLSLYHDQREDPPAYSSDLFASIAFDSIAAAPLTHADSIVLTVNTFTHPAVWHFGLR